MGKRRGILFLVVGASGVGKDSLIDGAQDLLGDDVGYVFPRRHVTRPSDAGGEVHHGVTEQVFARLEAEGAFMLSWRAHGHRYGIPVFAEEALSAGHSVVVNVSRQVIDEARQRWQPVRVLLITAPSNVLAARLMARGRETGEQIEHRLKRMEAYRVGGGDVHEVVNGGRLDGAIERFVALLEHEMRAAIMPLETKIGPSE